MGQSSSCSCSWLGLQRMFVEPRLKRSENTRWDDWVTRWVFLWCHLGAFQAELPACCLCASTVELETGLQPLGDATSAQLGHVDFCRICMDLDEFMWQSSIECKFRWRLWTSLLGLLGLLGLLASNSQQNIAQKTWTCCFDVFVLSRFLVHLVFARLCRLRARPHFGHCSLWHQTPFGAEAHQCLSQAPKEKIPLWCCNAQW